MTFPGNILQYRMVTQLTLAAFAPKLDFQQLTQRSIFSSCANRVFGSNLGVKSLLWQDTTTQEENTSDPYAQDNFQEFFSTRGLVQKTRFKSWTI